MKFLISLALLLLCIVSTMQLQLFENCPPEHPALLRKDELICAKTVCETDETSASVSCGQYACLNQIGYREDDNTKVFPDCCGGPICGSDSETVVLSNLTETEN